MLRGESRHAVLDQVLGIGTADRFVDFGLCGLFCA